MQSPSKLAVQRIYSPPRNHISFHSALQGYGNDLTSQSSVQASAETIVTSPQTITSSCANEHSFVSMDKSSAAQDKNGNDKQVQLLLDENKRQFKLVQEQIDLLRLLLIQVSQQSKSASLVQSTPSTPAITTPAVTTPTTVASPLPQPSFESAASVAPMLVQKVVDVLNQEKSQSIIQTTQNCFSCFSAIAGWQIIIFSLIFIIGLIRIIEWFIEKATTFFVSANNNSNSNNNSSGNGSSSGKSKTRSF